MMSITELVESRGYKVFMKYVYGWGASVVLIGALFKILHLPGAAIMLTVGLIVEALIFAFSAFEPLHEELDWTLVYPELAGLSDEFDEEKENRRLSVSHGTNSTEGVVAGVVGGGSTSALTKFDELLQNAEIGPEIFERLGEGMNKFATTTEKLADVSDVGEASKDFASKINVAAQSVQKLDEVYQKSSESLSESVSHLSKTYSDTAEKFDSSNNKLNEAYISFAEKITSEIDSVKSGANDYSQKLETLNSNLSALNAVYELQVNNVNSHVESTNEYYKGFNSMIDNISQTVDNTNKLNEGVQELNNNILSLNSVYGNMLSSINFNK